MHSSNIYGKYANETKWNGGYGDSGSFSRYFSLDAWAEKTLPFLIVPKASRQEKNKGCQELEGTVRFASESESGKFLPTKDVGSHKIKGNFHPTVKPLKLMSYLVTMGSREGDTVLDPFCGSGTTLIAAHQLHRKYIGIEISPEYCEIAKKRLEPYQKQSKLL
jgi:site-specific DNA-methyltransferase (adenine-specific)